MKKKVGKLPDCGNCRKTRVALIPENYKTFEIIEKWGVIFTDGMGGLNIQVIKDIIDTYNMDMNEKLTILKLIVIYYKTIKRIGDNKNAKK